MSWRAEVLIGGRADGTGLRLDEPHLIFQSLLSVGESCICDLVQAQSLCDHCQVTLASPHLIFGVRLLLPDCGEQCRPASSSVSGPERVEEQTRCRDRHDNAYDPHGGQAVAACQET